MRLVFLIFVFFFFFSSRRRHTRSLCDWSSDVCSSDLGVAWTPDGRVSYTSGSTGTYDIWVMQPDGSGQAQLTNPPQGTKYHTNGFQTFSADGRYMFFSSDRITGSPHIWRMDAAGGNLKQLTNGTGENF